MILFKIIGTRIRENHILDKDRKKLIDVLLILPEFLIKRLEIGPKFINGEVSDDNQVSMYFQLMTVRCSSFLPNEFYEDLIIFALSKYSFPDEKPVESKYQFIDIVFNVINQHKDALEEVLKGPSLKEKWTDMGHHWYTVLYLTHKFPVLKDATPVPPQYPWLSAGGWTGEEQDKTELKNYVFLAKVPTAWPNCTDMKIVEDLVSEHVPPDVSRSDLYTAMRKYVSEFTIKEEWKKKLLNSFDSKIGFLTSHIKKEPQQEETSEKPTPELKQDVLQNVVETSDAVTVPVEKVEEEAEKVGPESIGSENEEKKIEPGNETDENNVKTEELNDKGNKEDPTPDDTTCEVADKKLESFENNVQESKTEDAGTDTEQKKEESYVNLKPLRDVGRVHEFCKRYTDNEWERMPHVVQDEVMRQRKFYGFSNKF